MALSSGSICFFAVTVLAIASFQAQQVYSETECDGITNSTECCSKNCSFCVDDQKTGVCGNQECEAPKQDTCKDEPTDDCGKISGKETCCADANCAYCTNVAGGGMCSTNCTGDMTNVCAENVTTLPTPTTNSTVAPECSGSNETACCDPSKQCSFCKKADGSEGECRANGTCDATTETDSCAATTPTSTPSTGTTPNATTLPTTPAGNSTDSPSGGGSSSQSFDAPSFIGGIVLCGGIVAIVFFGCKFYKARKDQNYHTL